MSPESNDSRDRLTRVEERLRNQEEQGRQLWPLVAEYAVVREQVGRLRDDLNSGGKALRDELADIREEMRAMKAEAADRTKERRTMLWALFIAGIGLLGTFAAQLIHLGGHG